MAPYRSASTLPEEPRPKSGFIKRHKCALPSRFSRWWNNVTDGDEWMCECGKIYVACEECGTQGDRRSVRGRYCSCLSHVIRWYSREREPKRVDDKYT